MLNPNNILAHRGLFKTRADMNSGSALANALSHGFGIETDVRDLDGRIVICHDPPTCSAELPELSWLLDFLQATGCSGRIALNVKADGLCVKIDALFKMSDIKSDQVFVFDMSIPDSISYMHKGFPFYTRFSEYEPSTTLLDAASGVWIDNFSGEFNQVRSAELLVQRGIRCAIVSSELHGRDPETLWREIAASEICHSQLFELCTDYPLEAEERFSTRPEK